MKNIAIWLTYDMGVGGDFQGIYSWLDDNNATECGNNNAFFKYSYPDDIQTDGEFVKYIKSELESKVDFKPGNRIYIIRQAINGKSMGSFIIGKRKANPWEGFGTKAENSIDE
jgi:hypothetical protein